MPNKEGEGPAFMTPQIKREWGHDIVLCRECGHIYHLEEDEETGLKRWRP